VQRRRGRRARERVQRTDDLLFKAGERGQHFGNPLTGHILKIARFEYFDHPLANVLRQPMLEISLERGR
jgi:hypothetical protein